MEPMKLDDLNLEVEGMPVTQKRTCNRCRSLVVGTSGTEVDQCGLGYKTETYSRYGSGWITETKPLEPCPKPLTIMKSVHADRILKGERL